MQRSVATLGKMSFALVLVLVTATAPHAAVDVDLGVAVRGGGDTDLYFALSGRYFDRDGPTVERVARRVQDPDDVAVALFLCARSGRTVDTVLELRSLHLSWWEVGVRLGLERDVWFVPVERRPGPPYGKAYGHWKKHGRSGSWSLRDRQVRDLVAVRVLHEYYGFEVEDAMERRAHGDKLDTLMIDAYRERHGASTARSEDGSPKNGKGNGNGRGHGRDKRKSSG